MTLLLRVKPGRLAWHFCLLLSLVPFLPLVAQAQCPPAASACTPGNAPAANAAFGMGIFNVTLGTINNTTLGGTEGYKDYSCLQTAALTIGTDAAISIRTNSNADETVRVWADLNNDGTFNPTSELLFSSNNKRLHTGTVRLPVGTTTGVRLRLRVASDYSNVAVATPCSTPLYSQTEDYSILATASTVAPTADFVADQTLTCSGTVQFTDQSQNAPLSWLWNFGDGTTSTLQSPSHAYTAPGTYTVSLTATNSIGSNTKTRTGYVTYNNVVPVAAACTPQTQAYCCNYGITRFVLGTLTNTSADGSASYENFTCTGKVTLTVGNRYTISLTTNTTSAQDTRVWLDVNNDGTFAASEVIYQALNTISPSGSIVMPTTAALNQPLRLRVVSDYVGSPFTACAGIQYGQAEDYTVILQPNTSPAVADFTSNYTAGTCQTTVQFTDQSQNLPTSWLWSFGDGATSTLPSPSHTYSATGNYTVSLTTTNAFGSTTKTLANYVQVTIPCLQYCTSTGQNGSFWITNVALTTTNAAAFSSTSGADANGYGNYTTRLMTLRLGLPSTLTVTASPNFQRATTVWIDWNRDGVFATSEMVSNAIGSNGQSVTIAVGTQAALVGTTRMRIIARLNNNQANACLANQANAETEDYSVQIVPVTAAKTTQELTALEVFPNPTTDGRVRLRLTDANAAGTYSLRVESLLGARLLNTTVRLLPAQDAELDLHALPKGLYILRLQGADGRAAVRRLLHE